MDMWKDGSLERSKFNQLNANKRWNITSPITLHSLSQGKKNMALPKNYKKRNRIGVSDKWLC